MPPLAVFYHCKLAGIGIPSEDFALCVLSEQMAALESSGLAASASEIHVGVNGAQEQALLAAALAPESAIIHAHGPEACTELPTFWVLQEWLPRHADWFVLYHHSKGVTAPGDAFKAHHRRTMEQAVVWNWAQCVRDLERGYDIVGINYVDPKTRPVLPGRFYAGNFWWATARYLLELPPLAAQARDYCDYERMKAEQWIGTARRRPRALDYERPELSDWCKMMIKEK